jgi:SulP family sulfate permease
MNLVSAPVLTAFTQAAALLIVASQLPGLLGTRPGSPWWSPADLHPASAAFGLASLALLWAARQWRPGFPTILVLMLGSAALSQWIGFEAGGGAVVGVIPDHLPSLQWPALPDPSVLRQLLLPMVTITLISFLETASSARVEADREGRPWEQDRDLIGQGLAKLVSGLLGAFPTSASFSRSALYQYLEARSGWATVISSLLVVLVLLFMTPLLHHAPRPVLAAIVIVAVIGVLKPASFVRTWRISRAEALIGATTFAVTLIAMPELHWGVLVGVLLALSHSVYQRLHPRIVDIGLHADGSLRDRALWALPPLAPQVCALRMDAALDFATAHAFERAVTGRVVADPNLRSVCLFAQSINRIDATGVETFVKLRARLGAAGITLHLTGLKQPVEQALRAAGALTDGADLYLHRTDAEALAQLREHHEREKR